jgi:hypothetical protein
MSSLIAEYRRSYSFTFVTAMPSRVLITSAGCVMAHLIYEDIVVVYAGLSGHVQ